MSEDEGQVCENVTLAMDYKWFWQANGLTNITLTRTVGTIVLNRSGKGPKTYIHLQLLETTTATTTV